ncbi:MAG: biotin transporter BioY [Lachnospiraceae bacterium]|nr:biotin transporter BioY [Lachnospiraceae bacterium]
MRTQLQTEAAQIATKTTRAAGRGRTYDMAYTAVFAVLIAVCSWISIPTVVPFTLQTFAIFLAVSVLGGRRGTLSIVVYVLLGAVGIPVFAGFKGGIGVLLNTTGGYIVGFIFAGLVMWLMETLFGRKLWVQALGMALGMVTYLTVGTAWFMAVYLYQTGPVSLGAVLGWCVIPFLIPDIVKLVLALSLGNVLRRRLAGIMGE